MKRSLLALALLAAGCTKQAPPEPAPAPAPAAAAAKAPSIEGLVDDLSMLAIGRTLDEPKRAETIAALRDHEQTIDQYIDTLVHDPRFANVVVPHVLFGEIDLGPVTYTAMTPLRSEEVDGKKVYFYRDSCKPADTVEVAPWWDPKTKVPICKADYMPDGFMTKDGYSCSGMMGRWKDECGCGKSLINCTRDRALNGELFESLYRESTGIISHVVEHDEPFREIFTTKYSLRDRNAEYMRLRKELYVGKIKSLPDLSSWPAEGKWSPRPELFPGEHAGIITTDQYLYMSDGPRDRMRLVLARAWCTSIGSFGVTSDLFRKLVGAHADVRSTGEGWQTLAADPACSQCHARMDYGMQFLTAYPAFGKSVTPILAQSQYKKSGPMYMRDIDDKRGEGPLNAETLGKLLVEQPEFSDCMVKRVQDHVLGANATPAQHDELAKTFAEDGKMRPLFERALRQYADHAMKAAEAPPPAVAAKPTAATAPATGDQVTVPAPLAASIVEHCGDCHEDGDHAFLAEFSTKHTLPRALLIESTNMISAGLMPEDSELQHADKVAMLENLITLLAPNEEWATHARGYWLDGWRGSRTHNFAAVKQRVAVDTGYQLPSAGAAASDDRGVEELLEGPTMTVTPTYITRIGQLALKACRPLVADQAKYRACLQHETSSDVFLFKSAE